MLDPAAIVRTAVDATLAAGVATADLGGNSSTAEMGDEVLARLTLGAA